MRFVEFEQMLLFRREPLIGLMFFSANQSVTRDSNEAAICARAKRVITSQTPPRVSKRLMVAPLKKNTTRNKKENQITMMISLNVSAAAKDARTALMEILVFTTSSSCLE